MSPYKGADEVGSMRYAVAIKIFSFPRISAPFSCQKIILNFFRKQIINPNFEFVDGKVIIWANHNILLWLIVYFDKSEFN